MSGITLQPVAPAIRIPELRSGMKLTGIQRDEFLFPSSSVVVEMPTAMDAEGAQRAIGVERADNVVKVGPQGKKATWSPSDSLLPGRHVFQVGPLLSRSGEEIAPEVAIPFQFVPTKARVPRDVAVESMVRLRLTNNGPERLPLYAPARGKYIEIMKGVNRRTRAPVALAFNEQGRRVDDTRLLKQAEQARAKRIGKLDEPLRERLQRARPNEFVHVAVWAQGVAEIRPEEKRELEREVGDEPRVPQAALERNRAGLARARKVAEIVKELGAREVRLDDAAPVVFGRVRKRDVQRLARRREVAAVFLYDPEGIEDLGSSIAVANSDDVHAAGPKGARVKAAVWESGPTSTADLVIEDRFDSTPTTSDHSQHVHGIIKNKEANKPHGHAPECLLHSANSKDLDALRWAVKDKRCTVINQSFHRPSEPGSGSLSFDDVYKDWLILNPPYPTIVQAAGNFWSGDPDGISPPSSEFVNHKGYNSLAVANHDDSASSMSSDSVFRNPTTPHADRELPEITANGTAVTTTGLTKSGTSMASPATAGVAALLQSTDGTLKAWPEGCRAILLAAASRNVEGDTWWQDVVDNDDASDGSGAVNAYEGYRITQSRRGRNNTPSRRGWDVGTLASGDFDSNGLSTFAYRIQVPVFWFGPRHVKVALAWDSKVTTLSIFGITIPLSSQLTVDLDLKIFDKNGSQVGYSGSWDNSYEVAEFDAIPGETYDIRIRRWSGTDWTWFGLAWTVTGSLIDLGTILGAGSGRIARFADELPRLTDGG
jgi:Subtilase family